MSPQAGFCNETLYPTPGLTARGSPGFLGLPAVLSEQSRVLFEFFDFFVLGCTPAYSARGSPEFLVAAYLGSNVPDVAAGPVRGLALAAACKCSGIGT